MRSDTRLDEIVGRCRERLDRGEPLDAETVIAEHPDLASALRERLAVLTMLHEASARGPAEAPPDSGSLTGTALGPYRLGRMLGEGGMGAVYEARVESRAPGSRKGARVAVKVVHPHLMSRPGFFKRFLREAEIGRGVRHPNVVATLDADALEEGGRVVHFLAMEFVEGQTLRGLLDELGRVPEDLCRHVGREVAKGLAAIHAAGVVHRDLKPENVLITQDHAVKVMDLGVARPAGEDARLSQTGAFVGSLHYGAPEQFDRAAEVDGRADLYALGLTLYELATGQHPFADEDLRVAVRRQLEEAARPAAELNSQLSPFFEALLAQLLEKDRETRPGSADEVAGILEQGEQSPWWRARSQAIRLATKRPLRRIRIPRETALYGREAELARLRTLYEKARAGDGQVVLVEGEAGIGKSRLVDEFVGGLVQAGEDMNYLFGSYPPGGAATASGAFSTAYREHIGEGEAAVREAIPQTPLLAPAFMALLRGDGTPEGAEPLTKDSLLTVFVHATRTFAAQRPTVVLIDDLHFAPEEGRALFMSIALAVPCHRIMLVGGARPGLDEKWVGQLASREQVTRLPVPRLGPKELVHLLRDALRSERLAQELAGLIGVKSDGNPFFVFEMLRGLRDGQFLRQRPDGTWETTQVIREIQIPSSILELVQARVADLETAERDLLDVASCCGFEFDPVVVAGATGQGRIPTLKALAQIERSTHLVRSSGRRFVFDHHQVQEALYGSLPEALREEYHAAVADALERHHGAASKDPKDLDGALCVDLAEHFLRGAQGLRALRYLDAALTHLEEGYLNDAAIRLADRALEAPGLLAGKKRCETLLRRAGRLDLLGRRREQGRGLEEANAIADATGDPGLRSQARLALGGYFLSLSRHDEAQHLVLEAIDWSRQIGDREREGRATGGLGSVFLSLGRHEEARAHFGRALALAREIGDLLGEQGATNNLGLALSSGGRFEQARAHLERALALACEAGDRRRELMATGNLGTDFARLGHFEEARARMERALALARDVGYRKGEGLNALRLAYVFSALGRYEEARGHIERGLAVAREIGARDLEGDAACCLGSYFLALGRFEDALACTERHLALAREIGARQYEACGLAGLGTALAVQCRDTEATTRLREAAALAHEHGLASIELVAKARLATLENDARPGATADALAALATCESGADHSDAMEARFLLWRATGDRAHLAEAKRRLDFLVEHAPPDSRESMVANVRLHRDILAAAREAGL